MKNSWQKYKPDWNDKLVINAYLHKFQLNNTRATKLQIGTMLLKTKELNSRGDVNTSG